MAPIHWIKLKDHVKTMFVCLSYALDWLLEENLVKVLLRTQKYGEVVCSLLINPNYPNGTQLVELTHVSCPSAPAIVVRLFLSEQVFHFKVMVSMGG